ncbi:hypothetical protein [Variovorax sp. KK3]|uniref:hypothetical protein n=1 Tax=Variovorax sp. KK3 TaxID=1855728 RepID=UPI003AB03009
MTIHEVQHNASQGWYDEAYRLRGTSPSEYRSDLMGAERAATSVELMMRAEVAGWYADLQALRSLRDSGQMTSTEYVMRTQEGTIYANLMDAEMSGRAMGHSGVALANYVAEHAQGSIPSNYIVEYTAAMTPPAISQSAVRGILGFAFTDPAQMVSFHEEVGPDGSYTAIATYNNGERVTTTYDGYEGAYSQTREVVQPNGSHATTQTHTIESYNADGSAGDQVTRHYSAGRLADVVEVDSSLDDVDYGTRTTTYDAQGRIDSIEIRRDDGSRDVVDYDQGSSQAWGRVESHFDAQGRLDYTNEFMDDGSRTGHDYDQTQVRGDSVWSNHIDAQGRTDWVSVTHDDGSVTGYDYDQTNVRGDSVWSNHIDPQGRTDWVSVTQDDGGVTGYDYDQTNVRGDSVWSNHIDAQGRTDWVSVTQDDGSVTGYDYDQANVRGDSVWSNHIDAQGRTDWTDVTQDDGSHDWADYDQTDVRSDSIWQSHTDSWGRTDWVNVLQDDGSRTWYDYDQAGSHAWSTIQLMFDSQGQRDHRTDWFDNGERNEYEYYPSQHPDAYTINHYYANGAGAGGTVQFDGHNFALDIQGGNNPEWPDMTVNDDYDYSQVYEYAY